MTAGYFIIALLNSTIGTWTYALPLVIAAMIYLDIKMMMVMNAVIIISSVIRLVMQLGIGGTVLQNDVIAVLYLYLWDMRQTASRFFLPISSMKYGRNQRICYGTGGQQ